MNFEWYIIVSFVYCISPNLVEKIHAVRSRNNNDLRFGTSSNNRYTEVKKSVAMLPGTKANSSKNTILKEPDRAADDDVDDATNFEPFSSSTKPLFQVTTPCWSHIGKFSYAS
jgi:hypothetical protein